MQIEARFRCAILLWWLFKCFGFGGVAAFSVKCSKHLPCIDVRFSSRQQSNGNGATTLDYLPTFQHVKRPKDFSLFASPSESSKTRRVFRMFRRLIVAPLVSRQCIFCNISQMAMIPVFVQYLITSQRFLFVKPLTYLLDLFSEEIDLDDGTTDVSETLDDINNATIGVLVKESSASLSTNVDDKIEHASEDQVTHEQDQLEQEESNRVTLAMEAPAQIKADSSPITHNSKPAGKRWAVAAPGVDLSGEWELIVTEQFKQDYDRYLSELGQPMLVRSVALGIISLTTEVTKQTDNGKSLLIRGQNVRGTWDRTLVASGTEVGIDEYTPLQIPVMSADSEKVEAESWWENDGYVHVSWLRGVMKYGGGDFESRRFLDGDVYVCESTFHPNDTSKMPNSIVWRFRRRASSTL